MVVIVSHRECWGNQRRPYGVEFMGSHYYCLFIKHFKFGCVSTFYSSLNPMK